MENVLRLIVLLGLATSAYAQLDTESIPPAEDQNDLFVMAPLANFFDRHIDCIVQGGTPFSFDKDHTVEDLIW